MIKKLVISIVTILTVILFFEILSGYYLHRRINGVFRTNYFSFHFEIEHLINNIIVFYNKKLNTPLSDSRETTQRYSQLGWVWYPGEATSQVPRLADTNNYFRKHGPRMSFHPLIDFTGAYGLYHDETNLDYYGFRNKKDYYYIKNNNYKLVIVTGASEIAGYNHLNTITNYLEKYLNKEAYKKFKVINLGMNGYSLNNEINSYLALVYHLQPEYVISHGGWSTIINSLNVPKEFKYLGLYYHKEQVAWAKELFKLASFVFEPGFKFDLSNNELVVTRYIENIYKYKKIVESNKGKLIVGIQGLNSNKIKKENIINSKTIEIAQALMQELKYKSKGRNDFIDFSQFSELKYLDGIHSDDKSAKEIALIYSNLILKNEKVMERESK